MLNTYDPFRFKIATWIAQFLKTEFSLAAGPTPEDLFREFVAPPDLNLGDWAFGTFRLAKALQKKPPEIAVLLTEKISAASELRGILGEVKAAGPYVNFKCSDQSFKEEILAPISDASFFSKALFSGEPKTMVEYSQPNTHKELHVGHLRNACLGDALIRIKRNVGVPVVSATFPGDIGTHVAKTLWYLETQKLTPPETHRGEWLGKLYTESTLFLEKIEDPAKKEAVQKEIAEVLKALESGQGAYFEKWKVTREWSIELMNEMYQWLGVKFDVWYWESQVDHESRKFVEGLYKQGKLIQSQGAIGLDLSEEKLGFAMFLKSDGTGLYATKDLELARRKFQEHQIERSIYVVDVRQELHFKQVFKTLEKLGFEQAKNCVHLAYNFVELPEGAMSSRKGNIVTVRDLKDRMIQYIQENYLEKYQGTWSKEEIAAVANDVALGAIKFGMLKFDPVKKIVFDMKEWLKLEGDTGPFVQYSAARIQSVLNKAPAEATQELQQLKSKLTASPLKFEGAERSLVQQMLYYRTALEQSHRLEKPSILCTYLVELAKKFNFFYHECPILSEEHRASRAKRLLLAESALAVIRQGLGLLGIPTPPKM